MRKMVKGFVHRPGFHCVSSSLRDVFEFHGHKFSEDMVFGLDCSLGFAYWPVKRAVPPIFVGGRGSKGIEDVCRILGIRWERKTTTSAKRAWQAVRELIDNDVPVMLQVDMFYLDYFRGKENQKWSAGIREAPHLGQYLELHLDDGFPRATTT